MRLRVLTAPALAGLLLLVPGASRAAVVPHYDSCRPYSQRACLLPFPDDRLTVADGRTPTGRRLHLPPGAMPVNVDGARMGVADYNRADGFSPGSAIIARVPGLDSPAAFRRSHIVPVTDLARARAPRQAVLLIDESTGRRQLIWAEVDAHATLRRDRNLIIHPARNLVDGHRYAVALRGLKGADGHRLPAPRWFRRLRAFHAGDPGRPPRGHRRYVHIFRALERAHVRRSALVLAWDFTVASRADRTGRLLHIRNAAFARLGDRDLGDGKVTGSAPAYHVDSVEDFTPAEDDRIARTVTGTFTVPCYLDQPGCPPGARFHYASKSPDARPRAWPGNTIAAPFVCNIPRAALSRPGRPSLYGHGLLGDPTEINAGNVKDMAQEHDMVFCATKWSGMADEDIPNAVHILGDLGDFPSLADRLQQGVLDFLYLGRLMVHPDGFVADPAFRPQGRPVLDTSRLYYDGNSQGGIEGGITTAVAPDFTRSVLGVTGMDYGGLLLLRSTDWATYSAVLAPAYPDESERPLLLDLIGQLWDRGEADGYANHMTADPLPGTPAHKVLMQVAFGDHQVTTYSAEVEARTIGARLYRPVVAPGRSPDVTPGYGLRTIPRFPYGGSALVVWDSGPGRTDPPPTTNTAPQTGEDPHEDPRATAAARLQKSAFLRPHGRVIDVCGGQPCRSDAYVP